MADVRSESEEPTRDEQQNVDLGDLLQELRILLNGVEVLTGFLIVLPFSEGFSRIEGTERSVYLATFLCAVTALIFFAAPAAQHRLMRPLPDRAKFKDFATRMAILGLVPFSFALILSANLVTRQILWREAVWWVTGWVALLIATMWWLVPLSRKRSG